MWKRLHALMLLACLLVAPFTPARAVEPDEILQNQGLETRARALSAELRCLVCQNQSIDDSQAPLAKDLRVLVRQRLQAGDSDDQVRTYLVERYGDFILLKPPFKTATLLLWLTPLAVLVLGASAVFAVSRKARTAAQPAPLSEADRARLEAIVHNAEPGET